MHPDTGMQGICNNMVRKNQEMIAKFFGYILRVNKCERIVFDAAIEEAGLYTIVIIHSIFRLQITPNNLKFDYFDHLFDE